MSLEIKRNYLNESLDELLEMNIFEEDEDESDEESDEANLENSIEKDVSGETSDKQESDKTDT